MRNFYVGQAAMRAESSSHSAVPRCSHAYVVRTLEHIHHTFNNPRGGKDSKLLELALRHTDLSEWQVEVVFEHQLYARVSARDGKLHIDSKFDLDDREHFYIMAHGALHPCGFNAQETTSSFGDVSEAAMEVYNKHARALQFPGNAVWNLFHKLPSSMQQVSEAEQCRFWDRYGMARTSLMECKSFRSDILKSYWSRYQAG